MALRLTRAQRWAMEIRRGLGPAWSWMGVVAWHDVGPVRRGLAVFEPNRESSMISVRPTKSRFTLWTVAALLAVIVAFALPQSALAAPDRPTGLTATALDHDTVSLTWSHPDHENVDHYRVLRRSPGAGRLTQIATTQTTSYQDDGLQPETTYTYRVKPVDSEGAAGRRSARSEATTAAAPTITPAVPTPDPTPEHAQAQQDGSDQQGQNHNAPLQPLGRPDQLARNR